MTRSRHVARLAAALLLAVAALPLRSGAAADCGSVALAGLRFVIDQDHLVAQRDGVAVSRHQLPVVGSAWRCLKLMPFPDQDLLFIEWFGGAAGTSVIVRRVSLLAFAVRDDAVLPMAAWLLHESSTDADAVATHRRYRLTPTDHGDVDVELTGSFTTSVNSGHRPRPPDWLN